jgi:Fe-S cluster biosynthesis and repair protein YggX
MFTETSLDFVDTTLLTLKNVFEAQRTLINELKSNYENVRSEKELLEKTIIEHQTKDQENVKNIEVMSNEIQKLITQIRHMEEDNKAFTKVSQVVRLEKENTRLVMEVERLKQRLSNALSKKSNSMQSSESGDFEDSEDSVDREKFKTDEDTQSTPDELNQNVYEKVIKGTIYYVTDDVDMVIYEKTEDETVGKRLGQLKKENGKTKVSWDN